MSSVTTGSSFYAAVLLVLLLTVTQCGNSKFPNLHCDNVWDGPSAQNEIMKCLKDADLMKGQWQKIAFPVAAAFIIVATLVAFPISCFLTCLCSSRCKPSSKDGGKEQRCCLWMWIMFALIWAFGVAAFVFFGARQLETAATTLIMKTVENPINFLDCTADKILDLAYDWSAKRPLQNGISRETIDSVVGLARGYVREGRATYEQYVHWVPTVSFCIGTFAVSLIVPMFVFAYFHCCSKWLPRLLSCVYWLFAILFMALGFLMILLSYAVGSICGEIALHYDRSPGLIQWYALPMCQEKFNFANLNEMVFNAQKDVSQKACEQILEYCDGDASELGDITGVGGVAALLGRNLPPGLDPKSLPANLKPEDFENERELEAKFGPNIPGVAGNPNTRRDFPLVAAGTGGLRYPREGNGDLAHAKLSELYRALPHSSEKYLKCGKDLKNATECSSFGFTAAVISDTKVKGKLFVCPEVGRACTLQECATSCGRNEAKEMANKLVTIAGLATNVSIALSIGRPLLECNFIFDTVLTALPNCADIFGSTMMLAVGFFLGGMMFALSIYILLRGSCIWTNLKSQDEDEEEEYEDEDEEDCGKKNNNNHEETNDCEGYGKKEEQ
ncbi:hypothetical protein, conserved [Trypanosoma brucei brucei TREU927]|uniref:Uncharacterized protein n=1 Tax=Trypanosoma brucei brucei (strain 927/4 GUTat10.1) TaxID=185431 RepID=Q57TU1_TRYB2|nr:hypothetical protein, conserved [Trypanosoma brucei brucei TREU927]AAX80033.1 hypothetical protein, conserved [Trypanosoma brucei]AAZ13436.1 hypothetical protein, conserved [Trypanosoma brucei brucei TREU927]